MLSGAVLAVHPVPLPGGHSCPEEAYRVQKQTWVGPTAILLLLTLAGPPAWPQSPADTAAQPADYTPERLVAEFGPAVVLIEASKEKGKVTALGSGFVVSQDGLIVTNYHVVEGAGWGPQVFELDHRGRIIHALVRLINGDVYEDVSLVGYDVVRDVAVVRIRGSDLPTVSLGDSGGVKVGESVAVIGNPEGLVNSVSSGLLSGVRDVGGYTLHQITAPISHGSSGSPVFNSRGEVIGIAKGAIAEGQNLNFSVPINYVRRLISAELATPTSSAGGRAAPPDVASALDVSECRLRDLRGLSGGHPREHRRPLRRGARGPPSAQRPGGV